MAKNERKVIKELPPVENEVWFGELDDENYKQLIARYLNDICSINKSTLQISNDL